MAILYSSLINGKHDKGKVEDTSPRGSACPPRTLAPPREGRRASPQQHKAEASVAPASPDPLSEVLKSVMRSVLREELAELREALTEPQQSEYRDRQQEAQRLGISIATLDRLCRDGLPFVYVGESRRFRAAEVDAWLDTRRMTEGS